MKTQPTLASSTTGRPIPRIEITISPGVTFPDWSVVASETVRDALDAMFEAFGVEKRWSGLDDAQDRTRRAILGHYAQSGHAPSIAELTMATENTATAVREVLGNLRERDMVVLDHDGTAIAGAYPFTERDTGHRVRLGDRVLNAMCAIDALGVGAMYGRDVAIDSTCAACGDAIRVETRDDGRALKSFTPEGAIVWSGVAYADGCAATSLCTVRAFFCSDEHLASWRETEHPDGKGFRLSMDEGLQTGVAIFAPLLAPASSETS